MRRIALNAEAGHGQERSWHHGLATPAPRPFSVAEMPAAPLSCPPPEVDRLSVRTVTDNSLFPFLPSQIMGAVRIERAPPHAAPTPL